ncbi:MAG: hypothetical protein GX207_00605 [Peptococcaceae bacterium]|nr:hypothetical protein [Peptococcaceae bacterium]
MRRLKVIPKKSLQKLLLLIIVSSILILLISGCASQQAVVSNGIPNIQGPKHPINTDESDPQSSQPSKPAVSQLSTSALLDIVLDSTVWEGVPLCQEPQKKFDAVAKNFKELQELLQRKDCGAELLARYRKTELLAPSCIIETILAQQAILNGLTTHQLQELLALTLEKLQAQQQLQDIQHINHLGWLMGKTLQQIGYESFQQQIGRDRVLRDFLANGVLNDNMLLETIEQQTKDYLYNNNLLPQDPEPGYAQEKFEIEPSDKIPGWNKLEAKVHLFCFDITEYGMHWSNSVPDSNLLAYSFHYPQTWNFDGTSVFYDNENKKIAELAPVAETKIALKTLIKNYEPISLSGVELLRKKTFTIGEFEVYEIMEKFPVYEENSFCYSYIYLVYDGSHLFTILFYTYDLEQTDEELFKQIIASFRWEHTR